jgi:hypothetical protein
VANYQLTATDDIIRTADGAVIPPDPANRDRAEYDKWLAAGGVPDPYVAPPPVKPEADPQTAMLYDHENRIRAQEGDPPLSLAEFAQALTATK